MKAFVDDRLQGNASDEFPICTWVCAGALLAFSDIIVVLIMFLAVYGIR